MGKRIKIPFNVTLANMKGIKNIYMRFPDFNRKERISQMKEKFKTIVKEIIPAMEMISEKLEKAGIEYMDITFGKEGSIDISPSYALGIKARRYSAEDQFFMEVKESID